MDQKVKKSFELNRIRSDFPILDQEINGSKLIYFDNAASTQKPKSVIKSIKQYYESDHSNVHRGVHSLSIRATEAYEQSRRVISNYINAKHEHEVILTKGTTGDDTFRESPLSASWQMYFPPITKGQTLKITQNPLKNGALEGTWATLGPTCVPRSFPR